MTRAAGADRRRSLAAAAILAATTAAMSIWFFTARDGWGKTARLAADASYYHVYLASLATDRDLNFDDEYKTIGNWYRFGRTQLGRYSNVFGIGPAVFETPFFAVGHVLARASGKPADGFSRAEVVASLYASVLFSCGALFFAVRLVRRRLDGRALAVAPPLLLFFAGPVVYYAVRQPGYAHPFAAFFCAWLVDAWDTSYPEAGQIAREPRSIGTWLGLGALLGAAALARPQLATWGILLLYAAGDDLQRAGLKRGLRAAGPRWLAAAGLALLVFSPQILAWKALYGRFLIVPQGPGFMRWDSPAWSEVLFSSRNGLLAWSPLYALAAGGLVASCVRLPRLGLSLTAALIAQVVSNGAVWDWWAGGSFGGRRFDSCFVAFAYGLSYLLFLPAMRNRRARIAAGAGVAVLALPCAVANLMLAAAISSPTARIQGGEAPSVLLRAVAGPCGTVTGAFSSAVTFPVRALFALRHGSNLDAYDRVVGVHVLGELYPGLNSIPVKQVDELYLGGGPPRPYLVGFEPSGEGARLAGPRGRVLLPLNRRHGPLDVVLRLAPPVGRIALSWNGAPVPQPATAAGAAEIVFAVDSIRRGVNTLDLEGPPGTVIRNVRLSVRPGTPP